MKIGMVGIINNLSTRLNSHNAGWTYVSRSALESYFKSSVDILHSSSDFFRYDILVINEGVNYRQNIFNFFGGVQDRQVNSLMKFSEFNGMVYCVNEPIDYNLLITKRKELKHLSAKFKIPYIIDLSKINNKLILGDSHSLSVYQKGFSINRNDGKTLHGFLKVGLKNYISSEINTLVFYAGNIDIRFHLHKHGESGIDKLILELENQLKELKIDSISLVKLIPIEDESRKLPGTGLYKGKSFFGSMVLRKRLVNYFNLKIEDICERNKWNTLGWHFDYNNFTFESMEAKQSVHIRPSEYLNIKEFINGNY